MKRSRRTHIVQEMMENLASKPATVLYPFEKVPVPEGFRGRIAIRDEACIGCSKCAVVCPTECIEMVLEEKEFEVKGRKILRKKRPTVHVFSCIRCGLCEEYCPTEPRAIYLTPAFAGAGPDKGVIVR